MVPYFQELLPWLGTWSPSPERPDSKGDTVLGLATKWPQDTAPKLPSIPGEMGFGQRARCLWETPGHCQQIWPAPLSE